MAAADPSSPSRRETPAEEEGASGEQAAAARSASSPNRTEKAAAGGEAGTGEPASQDDNGVSVASHSGETIAETRALAAANKTKHVSPEDRAGKMAEALDGQQQAFDWSETEDDGEEVARRSRSKRGEKIDLKVAKTVNNVKQDGNANAHSEKIDNGVSSPEKSPVGDQRGEVNTAEERADDDEEADLTAKQRKSRWVCKECGKTFTKREMFNLHRHFHAHEDEDMPLTCKECGLTFQHRSSLIKHRSTHKVKEENLEITAKLEDETRGLFRYRCAECSRIFSSVRKLRDHHCNNAAEKPYHCTLCRQEFQFKVSVTKHMMSHSRECIFKCQECSQTFPNIMSLRLHQKSHASLKPYECPECRVAFKHYSVMEDHRRKHADNSSHFCNICGKSFKYNSLLHQHQYLHTGQKPFPCPECGKKFAFAQNMKAHCRQHRLQESKSSREPPGKQPPEPENNAAKGPGKENNHISEHTNRTFSCPLCTQTFHAAANLRAHMQLHEEEYEKLERTPQSPVATGKNWEKGHTCTHCPSVFRDESSLKGHVLSVHKSTVQYLEILTPPKKQLSELGNDDTQGKLLNIKSHKCSECGKTFRHRSVLELHMRIHSKDKPYQCKVCGKGFRFGSYLQQHVIIHTGKKPYKCPDCGKDFAFLQNMRTHQKLHQQKPFRCTSCRKGYSDESQLQHHMLSHNGDKPHKCDLCDKSFGLAYLLRDHMNTHTGERPHRCEECHKSFSWFSSLLVHQKIHARKKQALSHYNSHPVGARARGRGKRGGRPAWGWSRPSGVSEMVSTPHHLYPVSPHKDGELRRQVHLQPLRPRLDPQTRPLSEAWLSEPHPQALQWSVDSSEVTAQPAQRLPQPPQYDAPTQPGRSPGWADVSLLGLGVAANVDSHMKENTSVLGSHMSRKSSPSAVSEMAQQRQHIVSLWSSTPTSSAPTSSLAQDFSLPSSYMDGAALWSVRPTPLTNSQSSPNKLSQDQQLPRWLGGPEPSTPPKEDRLWDISSPPVISSTVTQPEKAWNGCEPQKPWASGLPTPAQIDQSSAMPIPAPSSHRVTNNMWDLQTPPGIPKTVNSVDKLVNNQEFQKQVSPGWSGVQTPSQKVPISIHYEPHRFSQSIGTSVWAFQNNSVGPQTLFTGQLKVAGRQELQQQPMATAAQIIINQTSPFFSPSLASLPPLALPGPHPLHTVAVSAMSRPPHPNIFFAPQPVMTERPHMPQTLPLPQLPPQTEPHKLGSRLPFPPERLLQCMICGLSFPRELDLQMHYLQHAQGEI